MAIGRKKVPVTISITLQLYEKLVEMAKEQNRSLSSVVEELIERGLEK